MVKSEVMRSATGSMVATIASGSRVAVTSVLLASRSAGDMEAALPPPVSSSIFERLCRSGQTAWKGELLGVREGREREERERSMGCKRVAKVEQTLAAC